MVPACAPRPAGSEDASSVTDDDVRNVDREKHVVIRKHVASQEDELTLPIGAIVLVTTKRSTGWWGIEYVACARPVLGSSIQPPQCSSMTLSF